MGAPLCLGVQAEQTRCTTTVLSEPTWKVSENEEAPQSAGFPVHLENLEK